MMSEINEYLKINESILNNVENLDNPVTEA